MTTNTKTTGQVKRLVLEVDGTRYALDPSVTKEEALSVLDTLSKGLRCADFVYSSNAYSKADYVAPESDVALRVVAGEMHESRAAAQQAADAAAAAMEVAK